MSNEAKSKFYKKDYILCANYVQTKKTSKK